MNMTKHNGKSRMIVLLALIIVAFSLAGCDGDDIVTVQPTVEVITGEETLDAVVIKTQEALTLAQKLACQACKFNESGENGDLTICDSMCQVESE